MPDSKIWLQRNVALPPICFTCGEAADAHFWVPNGHVNYVTDLPSCSRCRFWSRFWANRARGGRQTDSWWALATMGFFVATWMVFRPTGTSGLVAVLVGVFVFQAIPGWIFRWRFREPRLTVIEKGRVGIEAVGPHAIKRLHDVPGAGDPPHG